LGTIAQTGKFEGIDKPEEVRAGAVSNQLGTWERVALMAADEVCGSLYLVGFSWLVARDSWFAWRDSLPWESGSLGVWESWTTRGEEHGRGGGSAIPELPF
jgi:hypothetical protein